ncbi:MAG: tetratricopeptide repeat protein [Myxococcales bacterium]|nr:tetratricopeptide repeat protein [Myxococcales bacterium]
MHLPTVRSALHALLLSSFLLASGCPRQQIRDPEPDPEPVADPEPAPKPKPKGPARWSVGLGDIGWDDVPGEPPDRAFRANTEGWKRHEKGDWAGSKPLFEEAVDIVTEYDLARYNLACALSRLGQLDDALLELTTVLKRDFPRFKRKALEDPDLGNLRRSALGDELEWRVEKLDEIWKQAMQVGTPTIAWRPWTDTVIAAAQGGQGQLLRPGVWIDDVRRFVPAMELQEGVYSGLVDVERQQAILVTGARTADTPPQFRDAHLYVAPLSPVGANPRDASLTLDALDTIEVHAVSSGARVRLNRHKTAWRELRAGGLVRGEGQDTPDRPVLMVTPDGSLLTQPLPAGWSVKNRTVYMPGGEEVTVQSTHSVTNVRSLLFNADRSWAVLIGVRMKCGKDGAELRHAVDRIDLRSRRAEGLSNRDGAAAAVFGRDGALYLQVDDTLQRYASPDDDTFETLPEGILLVAPMAHPTCKK